MSPEARSELLELKHAGTAAVELVGGKALGLGRLLDFGFRVPSGFVVAAGAGLDGRPPKGLEAAIARVVDGRHGVLFAVRSSASGEDSDHASWAGQFETELSVPPQQVWDAVEACRASLASERAEAYAVARGLDRPEAMAVVIQEMVAAEKAGTIFSRGIAADDSLVIEAVRGVGAALVAGEVTPENVTVERDGTVAALELGEGGEPVLETSEISDLAELGMEIERAFGQPMDIEWALGPDGALFALQARPITATSSNLERPYSSWNSEELFRWGPTAGHYFYISDFVVATCEMATVARGGVLPWTVLTFDDTHQMVWLSTSSGWYDLAEHCFREVCLDDEALAELRRRYDVVCPLLDDFFALDWASLDRAGLRSQGGHFYDAVHEFWLATLPAELGNYGGEKVLEEALADHIPHPEVRSTAARMLYEEDGLSAEQQKREDLANAPEARAHWEAHRFDLSSYLGPKELSLEEFEEEKRGLARAEIAKLRQRVEAADAARRVSIENLGVPAEATRIGHRLASTLAWQEERKRVANRSMAIKGRLLERAAELLELEEAALHGLGFYELLALLDGDDSPRSELGKRSGVLFRTEVERLPASESRTIWLSYAHQAIVDPDAVSFSGGKVAFISPAPISGTARVITAASAAADFQDGDILIAPRTAPEFELLMRRAGAVITESGGQTSHTAVFCRENSLPGIVGLPNATRLVKDGERITFKAERVAEPGTVEIHGREKQNSQGGA
jgi:phosphohistidine swiveling domain-containing protein